MLNRREALMASVSVVALSSVPVRIVATAITTVVTRWTPALIQIRAVQHIAKK